ncbi:glutamine synthetase family protein [Erythrobacter westpacificensis]|uniref:Glutamine synthetase family protein n=1 Tax=Erythrobacter westpacificensis TaxID=1055231 RepID=A0ABP9K271_9SPHN
MSSSRFDMKEVREFDRIEAFIVDLNGVPRGKWLAPAKLEGIAEQGMALPRSLFAQDIWGSDVEAAGLAFGTGDPDGRCFPVMHSFAPATWHRTPTAQLLLTMRDGEGEGYFADPRAILAKAVQSLATAGLQAVVAVELEFYLLADDVGQPRPLRRARPGDSADPQAAGDVLAIEALGELEAFFDDVTKAAEAQQLPVDTILHENSPGQFEINLKHQADALVAADHAILLKRLVKAVARQHAMRACFMAKPFGDLAGNGMHVHTSVLDKQGRNMFCDDSRAPSDALRHAVGGLVSGMADSMLLFAPHANSYRRFRRSSHVPLNASWAWGDRTAAVRAIQGGPSEMRIEHRLAGADANPYLVIAAILTDIAAGIAQKTSPGPQQRDGQEPRADTALPLDWRSAILAFESSTTNASRLGSQRACDVLAACKWQDYDGLLSCIPEAEYEAYLVAV